MDDDFEFDPDLQVCLNCDCEWSIREQGEDCPDCKKENKDG